VRVTVRLFARFAGAGGSGEFDVDARDGSTVDDVWRDLAAGTLELERFGGSVSAAVNGEFARRSAALADGDEVAFCRRCPAADGERPASAAKL